MRTGSRKTRWGKPLLLTLLIGYAMSLSGCYRKVVGVRGPGQAEYKVYEPNYKPKPKTPTVPKVEDK